MCVDPKIFEASDGRPILEAGRHRPKVGAQMVEAGAVPSGTVVEQLQEELRRRPSQGLKELLSAIAERGAGRPAEGRKEEQQRIIRDVARPAWALMKSMQGPEPDRREVLRLIAEASPASFEFPVSVRDFGLTIACTPFYWAHTRLPDYEIAFAMMRRGYRPSEREMGAFVSVTNQNHRTMRPAAADVFEELLGIYPDLEADVERLGAAHATRRIRKRREDVWGPHGLFGWGPLW